MNLMPKIELRLPFLSFIKKDFMPLSMYGIRVHYVNFYVMNKEEGTKKEEKTIWMVQFLWLFLPEKHT